MAIKRISLRGISRTPSDRMTSDGGCAESLNVYLEDNELAPSLEPKDITESAGLPNGLKYDILYLHKTTSYSNYICRYGQSVGARWTQSGDFEIPANLADKNWLTDISLLDGTITERSDGTFSVRLKTGTAPDYFIADSEGNWYRVDDVKGGGTDTACEVVCSYGGKLEHAWVLGVFLTLNEGETINDITSVGNTIIISTSTRMNYALYKDGAYHGLGEKIPEPVVLFKSVYAYDNGVSEQINIIKDVPIGEYNAQPAVCKFITTGWDYALDGNDETDTRKSEIESLQALNLRVWEKVKAMQSKYKKRGYFCTPVLAKTALRLYDGSYIYETSPILLGAGYDSSMVAKGTTIVTSTSGASYITITLPNIYKATAIVQNWDEGLWGDIVESIDLFLSTDINTPNLNSDFSSISPLGSSTVATVTTSDFALYFDDMSGSKVQKYIEDSVIDKGIFYKVASFECDNPEELLTGYDLMSDKELRSQDALLLQEQLAADSNGGVGVLASKIMVYNNRLLAFDCSAELSSGLKIYPTVAITNKSKTSVEQSFCIRYHIRDDIGDTHIVLGRSLDAYDFKPLYKEQIGTEQGISTFYPEFFGFITHPDSRCYKVDILNGEDVLTLTMKPHPHLDCAYCFFGLSTTLADKYATEQIAILDREKFLADENRGYSMSNEVLITNAGNPFYFPLSGRFHFSGDIRGLATTTRALSTGQFGQFPLYVFTTDGIWAMTTKDDGSFSKATPLSREVALDRRVFPIDQAVIFITEKGVKMLSGSEVQDLSPDMNGRHWIVEDDAETLLNKYDSWYQLLPPLKDTTPFMAFMATAECMYDYTGARLIFFNDTADYQYVYMLTTGTWHKTMQDLDPPYKIRNALNSYPNCQACARDQETSETIALDFSTPLDVTSEDERRCIIATRPFDLEEPDVLKTINHLKIRGQYERYDSNNKPRVSYMLFGSQDGNTFHRLTSLRGKSWKLFRIIILATLKPTERISWIDVDYESRFNNRLR